MLSLPRNITEAEIDALHLPPDLALVHFATHLALEAALLLKSFGRYPDPDDQQLPLFFRVIYSLYDDRLPAGRKAMEPVRGELIMAYRGSQSVDLPTIAGVTGDCGHGTALALAEHIFDCACLDEDDEDRWRGGAAVVPIKGQERRRVIIANARYLPGGGQLAREQWKCIHPRIAAIPDADSNQLIAMMKQEVVLAAARRQVIRAGRHECGREYMELAIQEARKSRTEDGRNHPKVGAVVVKDGKVLAASHRGELVPGDHAEFTALEKKLGEQTLAGSTVYTTLEPCTSRNHPKVPCARRLIERKVARVVIGMLDPNPKISGKGQMLLREHNIATELFPADLAAQIEEMNRNFIREHQRQAVEDGKERRQDT